DLGPPDLKASSDSGVSSTDDISKATSLTFTVTGAAAGDVVDLLRAGTKVATGTAGAGGALEIIDVLPGPTPPQGPIDYTLRRGAETSAATTVTIDTVGPTEVPTVAPDLDAASDSGASSTDDITNDTSPTFTQSEALPEGVAAFELLRG